MGEVRGVEMSEQELIAWIEKRLATPWNGRKGGTMEEGYDTAMIEVLNQLGVDTAPHERAYYEQHSKRRAEAVAR